MNFIEDFRNIFNGLQALQNHLEIELNNINSRIEELEYQKKKENIFFNKLEELIQERNRG